MLVLFQSLVTNYNYTRTLISPNEISLMDKRSKINSWKYMFFMKSTLELFVCFKIFSVKIQVHYNVGLKLFLTSA